MVQPNRGQAGFMAKIGWPVLTALMASGIGFLIWQMWDINLILADVKKEVEALKDENDELKVKLSEKNRAQWSLLREISTDMRNQYVDVQYVKTIQATVVLPHLLERRESIDRQQTMRQLREETKELSKLEPMKQIEAAKSRPFANLNPILEKLESSKVMRKEPLTQDLDHYIEQQQQIQNVPEPVQKKSKK